MPILDIIVVTNEGVPLHAEAAPRLAREAGVALSALPGHTWVRLHALSASRYAEDGPDPGPGLPVFVSVLKARLDGPDVLAAEAEKLAAGIARVLERPVDQVHIIYEPPGAGRVAFGGRLLSG